MAEYTMTQYTSDVGSIYDELYAKAKASLDTALDESKLVDSSYGDAMSRIIQEIVQVSIQGPLQFKQAEDLQKKIDSGLYDAQKDEVVAQTQLLKDQDSELLLNGVKNRDLIDKQIDSEVAKKDEVVAQTQLLKDQDDELILNGVKNRDKLDIDIKLLKDQDSELLLNGVKDRNKLDIETKLLQDQDSELLLDGSKKREYEDKQIAKVNLDTELLQQQLDSNLFDKEAKKREEEIKLIDAQIDGTNRQTRGYDEHTKIELFKSQMNAYGILLSSGATDITPEILQKSAVNDIYNNLLNGTNIAVVD